MLASFAVDQAACLRADGDQRVEILAVLDPWRAPDYRHFRVKTAGETCTLRQDMTSGGWELTELRRSDTR